MQAVTAMVPKRDGTSDKEPPARSTFQPRMQPIGSSADVPARKPPAGSEDEPAAEAAPEEEPARKPRGSFLGKVVFVAGNGVAALSARLYSKARRRTAAAYEDFQGRPEHVRYRAYAMVAYGLILIATFAAQLYTTNVLGAYVRVQHVSIPETTEIFVRNDSGKPWSHVKVHLNGIYTFEREHLGPGQYIQLKADAFTVADADGRMKKAPRNVKIDNLTLDADQGHTDVELEK
jgi:hypothetical protein